MEYEPCYICGQETEKDFSCKKCTDEITKLHTEFHTFQVDFDEVVIRLYRTQRKIETKDKEIDKLQKLVAQLYKDLDSSSVENYSFDIEVKSREGERPGPYNYIKATVTDVGHADKGVILTPVVPLIPASDIELKDKEIETLNADLKNLQTELEEIRCAEAEKKAYYEELMVADRERRKNLLEELESKGINND